MRYKATFLVGFAAGFVAGARAGRERYEQIVKASRKVTENPTVQKAAKATGAKATELTKVAKDKAAERVPKLTETAKSGASKVRGQFDRRPGRHADESEPAAVNGTRPAD
jgi:tripartite-type tricarboxylate transporter receptor subunit TctC